MSIEKEKKEELGKNRQLNPQQTSDEKTQQQTQGLSDLVQAIIPLAREYVDFKKTEFQARQQRIISVGSHNRHLTYSLLFFLIGVVALTTVLTIFGKVSGDALLFLAGTLTGYMIVWIQGLIFSPTEESDVEE